MKKSQTNQKDFLKDLEGVLNLVEKIDNLDLEKTDLKILNNIELLEKDNIDKEDINIIKSKIIKDSEEIKNKYKDLDPKE